MQSYLHDRLAIGSHDVVDVLLVGEEVPEEAEGLHDDVDVEVGEEVEDLVGAQGLDDLDLDVLLSLESHVL